MYLDPWMVVTLCGFIGASAVYNHWLGRKQGFRAGVMEGITGTFSYLEKLELMRFHEDGSIEILKKKGMYK